jgi:hypothetical protein
VNRAETASTRDRILNLLGEKPGLSDREITDHLFGRGVHPSQVNQACRQLEAARRLARRARADGRIGNYATDIPIIEEMVPATSRASNADGLSEDQVKAYVKSWLELDGWKVEVAWGKQRGVDIVAKRDAEIWLIEAKGCGSRPEMRVNYFVAMLGELLQRMSLPDARYSIALPDMQQFRRLWERFPAFARERTRISALFVASHGAVDHT